MDDLPAKVVESLLRLVDTQRFSAYLVVAEDETLVRVGGNLAHYGVADLQPGTRAADQLPFMEGMLPLVETPFLLRSLEMPSGRVADVHFFADADVVWAVLLDMTAEHDETQRMQQRAYDMTLLSEREARLIAQLEVANAELARSREALLVTHNRLRSELLEAERYVRSCLPAPITEPFVVEWLFEPTTELGGDSFGYHWLDAEHFAFYLLDVCGHGIGSALLSVAANQTLRSQALPGIDFHDPEAVLTSLNRVYQMDRHNDLFFTIWYGVYHRPSGNLRFASAGHPAPIVVSGTPGNPGEVRELKAKGPALGMMPTVRYTGNSCVIEAPARLYLFSDGVFEIGRPDGSMLEPEVFTEFLARPPVAGESELEALLAFARATHGEETLEDDFSIVKLQL
jgi:sigma-B regulation protein RsbU (phosphoserine phosphatase)